MAVQEIPQDRYDTKKIEFKLTQLMRALLTLAS
jgi:hypothetical protein